MRVLSVSPSGAPGAFLAALAASSPAPGHVQLGGGLALCQLGRYPLRVAYMVLPAIR